MHLHEALCRLGGHDGRYHSLVVNQHRVVFQHVNLALLRAFFPRRWATYDHDLSGIFEQ